MAKRRKKKYSVGGVVTAAKTIFTGVKGIADDVKMIKGMKVDAKTGAMYKKGGIIQHD